MNKNVGDSIKKCMHLSESEKQSTNVSMGLGDVRATTSQWFDTTCWGV